MTYLKKWEEAISHTNVYAFCIPRQAYLYIVYLCLLELLVVKNYVKLEKNLVGVWWFFSDFTLKSANFTF